MAFSQARHVPHAANQPLHSAPNAALLIDFDNVTMGIRSDLGKELKVLLNSDIIRGKVAVQRAYADWRRYPQYIVPLAESSIDLIFAPAYGTAKKNATDLRMAIDAIELVFTRPEIGTFILLTGDSDFSSCVLKLKEYGKYVIGVGMRESSSDLLIQNCDEYYSYHALSGLTRAGDEEGVREDPWELVRRAAQQMASNRDVMRTDRLKQVMLAIDPGFNEKDIGYSKFSRFVSEAEKKGLLKLHKAANGQWEISVDGAAPTAGERTEQPPRERGRDRGRERGDNGRRRREHHRDAETTHPAPEPIATARVEEPQDVAASDVAASETAAPFEAPAAEAPAAEVPAAVEAPAMGATVGAPADLEQAYALLQQAVRALTGKGRSAARDGDVKRRMLEAAPGFDEADFGFAKFSRFLRQAHEAEVIDLNRIDTGQYEVSLPEKGKKLGEPVLREVAQPEAATPEAAVAAPEATAPVATAPEATPAVPLRGRRGRGAAPEGPPPLLPGQIVAAPVTEQAAPEPTTKRAAKAEKPVETPPEAKADARAQTRTEETPPEAEAPAAEPVAAPRRGRGRRGAAAATEAPLILPGQAVTVPGAAEPAAAPSVEAPAETEPAAAVAVPEAPEAEAAPKPKRSRSRARGKKETPAAAETPAVEAEAPDATEAVPAPPATFSTAALDLPTEPAAALTYLSTAYKGVGKKTAEALVEAFGDDAFRVLQEQPERVRALLGDRRANTLLEQWSADYERRAASAPAETDGEEAASEERGGDGTTRRTRGRRGGRGRGGRAKAKEEPTPA